MDITYRTAIDHHRPPSYPKEPFLFSSLMRIAAKFFFITVLSAGLSTASADDIDILVIGSSSSFSVGRTSSTTESGTVREQIFNPSGIANQLLSILTNDPAVTGAVNVQFEDIFKTKTHNVDYSGSNNWSVTNRCHSLAQHFMWPEGKAARLANFRGEGNHQWDYIVLCFDPYILGNFPGMVAEGVKLIQQEVAKSAHPAQILLFAQWPWENSIFSVDDYNEVVQRVGASAGLPVVPAGKAWGSYTPKDSVSNNTRPTPKGAYLGAASIYSKIFDRSAKSSAYTFAADGNNIADHALAVVQANAAISHFSGAYQGINPFQMKYVTKRVVSDRHTGTSTERGIRDALVRLAAVQRIQFTTSSYPGATGPRWDFNYGRGNDTFEDDKDYEVDPNKYDRSYGFPMHHYKMNSAPNTMPYGIDKQYLNDFNGMYDDGTDLGIAYNMIRPGTRELGLPEDVRAIPIRLMWLKMRETTPGFHPLRDNSHMSHQLDDATAAYMYTLLSGRCPVTPEPANPGSTEWLRWLGNKIGYETAWQMAHLTTRVPGFRVLPSSTSATTVTPGPTGTRQTMTVQFMYPPQEDVIVTVSTSNPTAAIIGPRTLVFTPENHAVPQTVTVAGLPGALSSEPFEVVFSTSSADHIFDGLGDAWAYTNNRSATATLTLVELADRSEVVGVGSSLLIDLGVPGSAESNTTLISPVHGTLAWSGSDVVYTPNAGYIGEDEFAFAVNVGGTLTTAYVALTVEDVPSLVISHAGENTTVTEGGDSDTYWVALNGAPDETVSVSLTVDDQVTVTPTTLTFAPGNWNVPQAVTVTAVDDDVHELLHTGIITHTTSSLDPDWDGLSQDFIVIIIDNDNTAPVANAGPNQTLGLSGSAPWTPAELTIAAWYDASDAATITATGGAVSEWRDKSGNTRHATQGTPANQPAYIAEGLNGRHVVQFDGANDFFSVDLDFLAGVSHSAFIVTKPTHFSNIYGAASASQGANSLHVGFNGANYRMNYWGNNFTPARSANFLAGNANVMNYAWRTGVGKEIFANGRSEGSNTDAGNIGTMAGGGRIGHTTTGSHSAFGGDIAEIIMLTGAVDASTRQTIEGYLAHKWGLATSLPVDHPFEDAAPGAAGATATLNGMATDADGDALITTWIMVSGPGEVVFADASALHTTAAFSALGTYVLRLSADDSMDIGFDEVTITVTDTVQQTYSAWIAGFDAGGQTGFNDDYNNDGVPNGLKYFFDIDPTVPSPGVMSLAMNAPAQHQFTLTHPLRDTVPADIHAEYRWSKDLVIYHADGATDSEGTTVTFARSEPVDGIVTVTATLNGTPTDRVFVTLAVSLMP
jgi:hypothetical protein